MHIIWMLFVMFIGYVKYTHYNHGIYTIFDYVNVVVLRYATMLLSYMHHIPKL